MEGDSALDQVRGGRRGGLRPLGSSARRTVVVPLAAESAAMPRNRRRADGPGGARSAGRCVSRRRTGELVSNFCDGCGRPGLTSIRNAQMVVDDLIQESDKATVMRALLLRHRHVDQHSGSGFYFGSRRKFSSYTSLQVRSHSDCIYFRLLFPPSLVCEFIKLFTMV